MSSTKTLQKYSEKYIFALTIWREARSEVRRNRPSVVAVAFQIKNRVENPSWWGGETYSSVVTKFKQYSSMTHPDDKQLTKYPQHNDPVWLECLRIADNVSMGKLKNPIGDADHYHDISVNPYWAKDYKFVRQIGKFKFYKS